MKKETSGKKSKLWLWITIAVAAALVVAGVLCFVLGVFGSKEEAFYSDIYWNLDRAEMIDPATGLSNRERTEDGLYHIRFIANGEVMDLTVADAKLVNKIDTKDIMCLKFDADGVIIDVVNVDEVYVKIADKAAVQQINGNKVQLNSSSALNGMIINVELPANMKVSNVAPKSELYGSASSMEPMDIVTIYGLDEDTPCAAFINDRWWYSECYWRVSERMYDSTNKCTTRKPAEDGYWYVDWTVNGETVTLRTNRQDVANAWDGYTVSDACCGMVFDENGDVIDCFNAAAAKRGIKAAIGYDITYIAEDNSTFTATRILFGNEVGKTYTSVITEDTKIYNVNSTADVFGEPTELQLNDRLLVITDSMGKAQLIYVTNRMVDSPMYYNVSRSWSSGLKQSNRKPDASGWYNIKLAALGREVTYRTRDFAIVNKLDSYGMSLFGLKVENGIITKVYDAVCVAGNYSFAPNYFVDSVDGLMLATTSTTGTAANGVMSPECEVYDVSGYTTFKGACSTVREGDRVICYKNAPGEITYVYIVNRYEPGSVLYWNVNRYYANGASTRGEKTYTDPETKEVKPLLDENGYYHFRVIKVGSTDVTWVKTNDKALVDKMDSYGTPTAFSIRVNSSGVVTAAYPSPAASGGYYQTNYLHVTGADPETPGKWHIKAYSSGATGSFTVADNVAVYDFSQDTYVKGETALPGTNMKGSRTTLRAGDKISAISGRDGKVHTIMVVEREVDGVTIAFRKGGKVSQSEDGYWYFNLLINGETKVYKTNDEDLANKINGQGYAFTFKANGDVITNVYHAVASSQILSMAGGAYYDVVSISGGKVYLKRNRIGQSDTGNETSVALSSNYKAYTIDPSSEQYGKQVTLKKGDRIFGYYNYSNEMFLIYVAYECTREGGNMGYCEHCGQTVHWESIAAGYAPGAGYVPETAHYYVPNSYGVTGSTAFYANSQVVDGSVVYTTEFVLDLNGKTWTRKNTNGAASSGLVVVGNQNTLIITDYSKSGNGAMVAQNGTTYSSYSGLAHCQSGATLIIEKGLFDVSMASCAYQNANCGAITVGGNLIVNGGTIKGFAQNTSANWGGTAIGSWGNTSITINGGTIIGGSATNMGGTISANGDLTINGGHIYGGSAALGDNIRFANGHLTINGGEIDGGIHVSSAKSITLSGTPKINEGTNYGLKPGAVKIDVSGLKAGARVYVDVTGVFTKELSSPEAAQALVDNGALRAGIEGYLTQVEGNTVACVPDGVLREWTNPNKLPDVGRWKLAVDVTVTTQTTVSGELYIDLNGHNITRNVAQSALTAPQVYNVGSGKLTIDDTSAEGNGTVSITVPEGASINAYSAVIHVPDVGEMTLEGGIIDGSNIDNTYVNANNGTISVGGKLTVNGGTIKGFKRGSSNGGAIGAWANTEIVINGGEIYAGGSFLNGTTQKVNGAAIATTGNLTINGGKFIGPGATSDAEKKARSGGLIYANGDGLYIHGGEFVDGFGTGYGFNIYYERNYRGTADENGNRPTITGGGEVVIDGDAFIKGGVTIRSSKYAEPVKLVVADSAMIDDTGAVGAQNIRLYNGQLFLNEETTAATTAPENTNYDISIVYTCQNVVKGWTTGHAAKFEHNFGGNNVCDDCGHAEIVITISKTTLELEEGAEETITVTVNPADTTVAWSSSDESVATVDANGKITAVGAGTATITATATREGATTKTATCEVTVTGITPPPASSIETQDWAEWTDATKLPTAGKYKLMTNVTINTATALTGELWLDLNGFTVTMTGNNFAINTNGQKLVIDDLSGKTGDQLGKIVTTATSISANASVIYVGTSGNNGVPGELILNDGIIDGTSVTNTKDGIVHGAITVGNATNTFSSFTMNGGIVKGHKSSVMTTGVGGSALGLMNSTTFVMNGGILYSNSYGSTAANVCCTGSCINAGTATITINDGVLYAGRAQNHGGAIYTKGVTTINGGIIYGCQSQNSGAIYSEGTELTINGGYIQGGKTVANPGNGGAVDKYKGTVTIGGNAVIGGGVNIRGNAKLVLKDSPVIDTSLGAQQRFDIRINGGSIHLNSASSAAIQSTNGYYSLTYGTDGKVNGVKAYGTATESATLPTAGNVKLTADVTLTESLVTTGALVIDLNGHTVTYTGNAYAINAKHNLTIKGTGTIVATGTAVNAEASVIYVTDGAKLVVLGGVIDGSVTNGYSADLGGAVTLGQNCSLVMMGGEIKGQRSSATGSTGKGGGCVAGRAGSTITMYGGNLTAYSQGLAYPSILGAAQGSCISTAGTTYIHGGTLTGNIVANHGGTIYSTGDVYITGGLITGGTSTHSGNISCSGSILSITGGTIINGTAKSGSALGGHNIDKYNGTLIIGGNAVIAGGVSTRGNAKLVISGSPKIDKTLQTAQNYNIRLNSTGGIYLNSVDGTRVATDKTNYNLSYDVNGKVNGVY